MNEQSQSSFIPKNPVRGSSRPRPVRRIYLLSIIASSIFVATLMAAVGIFIYTITLERELAAQQQRLNEQRDSFSQSNLEQVLEFEARLEAANQILSQQVYVPVLLEALEQTALQSTTYSGFEYEKDDANNSIITLNSTNPSFDGIIFQREVLASNEILQGAKIQDISYGGNTDDATAVNQIQFAIEHTPNSALLRTNQPTAAGNTQPVPTAGTLETNQVDSTFTPEEEDMLDISNEFDI